MLLFISGMRGNDIAANITIYEPIMLKKLCRKTSHIIIKKKTIFVTTNVKCFEISFQW